MSGFIVIAALAILLIGWSAWRSKKNKNAAWTGVIVDKKVRTKADLQGDAVSKIPVLSVKLDGSNKTKHVEVTGPIYDVLKVGDKVAKAAGADYPTKIAKG